MASPVKREVLGLYKKILRLGRSWNAINKEDTAEQSSYIAKEAKFWFGKVIQ